MNLRLALAVALSAFAAPLAAQGDRVRLDVAVAAATALTDGPLVSSSNLLSDSRTRELLRQGFPTRIHYRLELWAKGGFFDDLKGRAEWDVIVAYDPTTQLYNVVRRTTDDRVREDFGGSGSVTSAEAQFSRPFRAALHPDRSGRFYYNLGVDVQTLTESDLDALQQWLRGPTAPGNTNNPVTVVRSGVGALLSRVLGGAKNHYETASGIFAVP